MFNFFNNRFCVDKYKLLSLFRLSSSLFFLFLIFSSNIYSQALTAEEYVDSGNAKSDLKDYRGAIADYTKAIEINPNFADAYYNRGLAKADLKDYRGAIADYTKAIEIDPNDAKAYVNRGNAKFELGDKDGACLDWSKAGELGLDEAYDYIKEYCN